MFSLESEHGDHRLPNLRYHVFISKETTADLAEFVVSEWWGSESGYLYKYLDYVWRCQVRDQDDTVKGLYFVC